MIISIRLEGEDLEKFERIKKGLITGWEDILKITPEVTNSEVIRACIGRTYYELYDKES